jgi:hypothetical protein
MENGNGKASNERMDRVERVLEQLGGDLATLALESKRSVESIRMLERIVETHEHRSMRQERQLEQQDRDAEDFRREYRELIRILSELTARLPPPQANT